MPAPAIGYHFSEWGRPSYARVAEGLCGEERSPAGVSESTSNKHFRLKVLERLADYTGKPPLAVPRNKWSLVFGL